MDIIDLKDYDPENNIGYRYVLVVIDNFSKVGLTVLLRDKNARIIKDSYENILTNSKGKPNFIETGQGKDL